jgi:hypothetical protein
MIMNDDSGQDRRAGGTVQPANRRGSATPRTQKLQPIAAERYELRDPFAEVTYRANTLQEMVLQAERVGAIRFHAVTPVGARIPVEKSDGEWKRADGAGLDASAPDKDRAQPAGEAARTPPPSPALDSVLGRIEAEAAQAARLERLERELSERYIIKRAPLKIGSVTIGQTEYRYRGDTARIAFTESTFRLATDNNSPSVARSMVDVAEARRWQSLRISGHEDFRRMVWLEASMRGLDTVGYEPNPVDRELLRKERDARQVNRIAPSEVARGGGDRAVAAKPSGRGGGGRKAVLAALEAVLIAKHVPARQRQAVMAAAAENLAARLQQGEVHKIKVFDKTAPTQREVARPPREVQRPRERAPAR